MNNFDFRIKGSKWKQPEKRETEILKTGMNKVCLQNKRDQRYTLKEEESFPGGKGKGKHCDI